MMTKLRIIFIIAATLFVAASLLSAEPHLPKQSSLKPIAALVGEDLTYDISFLWFDQIAIGHISLVAGEKAGTYLATLEAKTLGVAAFLTRNRQEKFQTSMELGPDGLLRPLEYRTFSVKTKGGRQRQKQTSYEFDYQRRHVKYQKIKDHVIREDELLPLPSEQPVFDILSAFYNLRCGLLGPLDGEEIHLPTYHRRGIEEITIAPVAEKGFSERDFFAGQEIVRNVLVDPEVFKSSGRDLFIGFDRSGRPQRAVVKRVIGLGDVRGVLRDPQERQRPAP